ncbi:hypothetical protein F5050DRAFT_1890936 [Lentinula boryana]|uniref:Cellular morphogenesis-related protein n=1 Tax=Lentinula boryana TaxID=40481 RepID=A0ABQ8QTD3_9AGAR|nr:hypothetical protein F5050DRAFT_1890936 [Lentinula boryana]
MNFIFTPNHVQLLNSCYPPTSTLLTSGPEYSPNSQELSRLTYYASNHPEKLTKLGSELEKRVKTESRKARSGNIKIRASLLITLAIFRSLATECRRDIALLSPSLIASVESTLSNALNDLEVAARAASVFIAWTTFTDGHLIGADSSFTENYLTSLRHFASLCSSVAKDLELRNRTRLVGFAAITGALNSEALYNDSSQFRTQTSIIMRPILQNLLETNLETLNKQAGGVKEAPMSPYLAEFRTRPIIERRAASIHIHVDGENGPSMADVSSAALRAISSLLEHVNGSQLGHIMRSSFDSLDQLKGWNHINHCCWYTLKTAEWAQYQYRYAVPTWLVERLLESQDAPKATDMHQALTAMVSTVFNSPVPLINLSTSDILTNLMTLLMRRISIDLNDSILPSLIKCISSLGRHVYYSDQIHDLASELITRLSVVEMQGISPRSDSAYERKRAHYLRCLIISLVGLIDAADDGEHERREGSQPNISYSDVKHDNIEHRQSRRARVPPEIWQETISFLLDADYALRADYADALVFYMVHEMHKRSDVVDVESITRVGRVADGPKTVHMNPLLHSSDMGGKFLHALFANVFILASTSSLNSPSPSTSSPRLSTTDELEVNIEPATPIAERNFGDVSSQHDRRHGVHHSRTRKLAAALSRLDKSQKLSTTTSASLSDYLLIHKILIAAYEQLPVRSLMIGVPMLLSLDALCQESECDHPDIMARVHIIRYILASIWLTIGRKWGSTELKNIAEKVLSAFLPFLSRAKLAIYSNQALVSLPSSIQLPDSQAPETGIYHPPQTPVPIPPADFIPQWSGVDTQAALSALVSHSGIQETVGLDREELLSSLSIQWSAETALKISVERPSTYDATLRGDGVSPLLKISPGLMHIENISLQSLARSNRGVGVTDLREALEGRSSMSNTNLARPGSISTLDHSSSVMGGEGRFIQTRPRSRAKKRTIPAGTGEVRDVLNKLGLGKQNGSLLKASFPALQSEQRCVT